MTIHCAYDVLMAPAELKPHPKNPNTHSASQIAAIAKVIEGNGWRAPITVSSRSQFITRGHGRLEAAILMGIEQVPVDLQDYESEQAEIADMIADNHLSELSEMDDASLCEVLKSLQAAGHDVSLAGFTEDEFLKLTDVAEEVANSETIPQMEMQAFEHYDYLCFMFKDIRDWLRVIQILGIGKVNFSISRKTAKIGIGRIINGKYILERLEDKARHHVTGQGGPSQDPAPGPSRHPGRSRQRTPLLPAPQPPSGPHPA